MRRSISMRAQSQGCSISLSARAWVMRPGRRTTGSNCQSPLACGHPKENNTRSSRSGERAARATPWRAWSAGNRATRKLQHTWSRPTSWSTLCVGATAPGHEFASICSTYPSRCGPLRRHSIRTKRSARARRASRLRADRNDSPAAAYRGASAGKSRRVGSAHPACDRTSPRRRARS